MAYLVPPARSAPADWSAEGPKNATAPRSSEIGAREGRQAGAAVGASCATAGRGSRNDARAPRDFGSAAQGELQHRTGSAQPKTSCSASTASQRSLCSGSPGAEKGSLSITRSESDSLGDALPVEVASSTDLTPKPSQQSLTGSLTLDEHLVGNAACHACAKDVERAVARSENECAAVGKPEQRHDLLGHALGEAVRPGRASRTVRRGAPARRSRTRADDKLTGTRSPSRLRTNRKISARGERRRDEQRSALHPRLPGRRPPAPRRWRLGLGPDHSLEAGRVSRTPLPAPRFRGCGARAGLDPRRGRPAGPRDPRARRSGRAPSRPELPSPAARGRAPQRRSSRSPACTTRSNALAGIGSEASRQARSMS